MKDGVRDAARRRYGPGAAVIGFLMAAQAPTAAADLICSRLTCEYLEDPLAIEAARPRLSWVVESARRGERQTAFQVVVATTEERLAPGRADLWDSGRVESGASVFVEYAGEPLRSRDRCFWRVRAWGLDGEASEWSATARWQMGLLERSDWRARWIGDPSPLPADLPAHNGYHSLPSPSRDQPKWVVLDLGRPHRMDAVVLTGARPFDQVPPDAPGYLFPVRFRVESARRADFSDARVLVDRTGADVPNPGSQPCTYRFEEHRARYVRLVVTKLAPSGEGEYAFALAELEALHRQRSVSRGAPVLASDSLETATWSRARLADGDVHPHPAGPARPAPPPALRREFTIEGNVRRATAYATALGLYELRLNGHRVGDHVLAPGWTDYRRRVEYQTHDVTRLLTPGRNAILVLLADGWYAGRIGMTQVFGDSLRAVYGRKPRFLLQLEVELEDGGTQVLVTDETWRSSTTGSIRSSDLLDGETRDLRRGTSGWDERGFDDAAWSRAEVADRVDVLLVGESVEPIRVTDELPARRVTRIGPGVAVYDFAQQVVGRVRLRALGSRGDVVTFRHGPWTRPDGSLYLASNRGALQTDRFILNGEPGGEVLEPRFTVHGFRLVEIAGLDPPPEPSDVTAVVFHSDVPEVTSFECSSVLVNRLWENALWTVRTNLMSVPTDCPDRDERLPWVVPAMLSSEHYLFGLGPFVARYAAELRRAQHEDGGFPNMAPEVLPLGGGVPGWGEAAGVWMPWISYVHYGDRRLLEEHYEAARRSVERAAREAPDRISREPTFGDWLNGDTMLKEGWPEEGAAVPHELFATTTRARSARTVAGMARALGRAGEAERFERLFGEYRDAFRREFVEVDGRLRGDTQGGYALALGSGLLGSGEEPLALARLLEGVRRRGGRFSTGNHATHVLLAELSERGEHELAYRLATDRACPSWGYMVDRGATAIWERWDSYLAGRDVARRLRFQATEPWEVHVVDPRFQDHAMNSFNHRGFATVVEWLMGYLAGMQPDESAPGFRRFVVRPRPVEELQFVRARHRTVRGDIAVSWRKEAGSLLVDVTVPVNSAARLVLPGDDPSSVLESGSPVGSSVGVEFRGSDDGALTFELASGTYAFRLSR